MTFPGEENWATDATEAASLVVELADAKSHVLEAQGTPNPLKTTKKGKSLTKRKTEKRKLSLVMTRD